MAEGWIEEGLVWRGTAPPQDPSWTDSEWVAVPREAFVPVGKARLAAAIARLPSFERCGERLEHLLGLLSGLVHVHYAPTLDELKADYELFAPNGGERAREGVAPEELARRERRFVVNFLRVALRGNFAPFTARQHRRATAQTYLFDLPVEVQWEAHDPELLRGVFEEARRPEGAWIHEAVGTRDSLERVLDAPPEMLERALVLHRGVGIDRTEGLFLWEKIDRLLLNLGRWIVRLVTRREVAPHVDGSTEERKWVRRRGLADERDLGALFRRSRLQEPTLATVLVLYRLRPRETGWAASGKRLLAKVRGKNGDATATDPTIWLKVFRDVPLADCEIVFPEKRVRMKAYDATMMAISAVLGLVTLVQGLVTEKGGKLAFALVALVFAYGYKLFSYWWYVRLRYQARLARDLYERNLDNSIGVLHYLVDSLEEQELKEAALAYALLLDARQPLTADELDARAEEFLSRTFPGVEIDFEVDDALAKVAEGPGRKPSLPIVREVDGRFEAKPVDEALGILDEIWDRVYRFERTRAAP